jgi:hypothetical protein
MWLVSKLHEFEDGKTVIEMERTELISVYGLIINGNYEIEIEL